MSRSIFNNVYSYRAREGSNARENFLIELFAFSLEHSDVMFDKLMKLLEIKATHLDEFSIITQAYYESEGRPDIELFVGNHHILIECKVDADEGHQQLERYTSILENRSDKKNKHLLFLTKRYEYREPIKGSKINMHFLRWSQIYKTIPKEQPASTIYQFKKYLKEQNMSDKSFNLNDMTTMLIMSDTIAKLDEVLDRVKINLPKEFGEISKSASRRTKISNNWYGNYRHFRNFHLWWGFYWSDEDCKVPELFVQIRAVSKINRAQHEEKLNNLVKETDFDDFSEDKKGIDAWNTKSMISFMQNDDEDDDNILAMEKWLLRELNTLFSYEPNT